MHEFLINLKLNQGDKDFSRTKNNLWLYSLRGCFYSGLMADN